MHRVKAALVVFALVTATAACATAKMETRELGPTGVGSCRSAWQARVDAALGGASLTGDHDEVRKSIVAALPAEEAGILSAARAQVIASRQDGSSLQAQQQQVYEFVDSKFAQLPVCKEQADSQMYYFGDSIYVAVKARSSEGVSALALDRDRSRRDAVFAVVWSLVAY